MLDAVLLVIVSPYISGIREYITNPTTSAVFKIIMFIIGIVAFAILTFYLLMRHYRMLKGQKETSIDVYPRAQLDLDDFLKKAKKSIDIFGITLEATSGGYIRTIRDMVKSEDVRKVRVLLYNPENKPLMTPINN